MNIPTNCPTIHYRIATEICIGAPSHKAQVLRPVRFVKRRSAADNALGPIKLATRTICGWLKSTFWPKIGRMRQELRYLRFLARCTDIPCTSCAASTSASDITGWPKISDPSSVAVNSRLIASAAV